MLVHADINFSWNILFCYLATLGLSFNLFLRLGVSCLEGDHMWGDQQASAGIKGGPHKTFRISDGDITVNNIKTPIESIVINCIPLLKNI